MSRTSWNGAEDEALDYLRWDVQVLYLRVLRARMDYRTGIVGLSRRISRRAIQEWLEVRTGVGGSDEAKAPTADGVRWMLGRLMRAGLIERVEGYERTLVFRLPLADRDQSVSGKYTRGTPEEHPSNHTPHPDIRLSVTTKQRSSNTLRARVDRTALASALADLDFHFSQVHTPKCMRMLDRWAQAGVTPDDVDQLVGILRERMPGNAFGPMYLDKPMADWLSAKEHDDAASFGAGRKGSKREQHRRAEEFIRQDLERTARRMGLDVHGADAVDVSGEMDSEVGN